MSKEVYSKSGKPFPRWLVLKVSDCSSSTFYGDSSHDDKVTKRGRKPILDDSDLLNLIKEKINSSPFFGEGYRKIWYKLRRDGFSVDKARVLKIMRNNNLLSPYRTEQCKKVSHRHDSKITTSAPNLMWGTDGKMFFIEGLGWAWLFAVIDHFNDEIIAWHVSLKGDRFAAMEPIKKAVKLRFGSLSKNICNHLPLRLRSDHGTQYDSKDFMNEMAFLGLKMSKSFVREPQCNGCIERFNRTIEQEVFSVAHICSIEDAIERISKFVDDYNSEWFIHRLQMTPIEFRRAYEAKQISFGEANDIYDACVTTESVSDSQG